MAEKLSDKASETAMTATEVDDELELDREIQREEAAYALYGGDDPHEPPSSDSSHPQPSIMEKQEDPWKVGWDGANDPENPQNWSKSYKIGLTALVSALTFTVTFASTLPTSGTQLIAAELHTSVELANLVTSVFLLGYVFGPLLWAPGSELVGRRPIFFVTMLASCLFCLGPALATNLQTLLVTRFLGGVFASAPLTNSGGVIADIWDIVGRGKAVSIFMSAVFMGPVCGPIVGGFVAQSYLGWRWIFWIMMITTGTGWAASAIILPETYAPVLLQKKARRLRKVDPVANQNVYADHERQDFSMKGLLKRTVFRPFHMLLLEPILVLTTLYLSMIYGLLYGLFQAFPIIFIDKRGFNLGENGLAFIGVGIGVFIGAILNILMISHYPKLTVKWRGHPPPEERLYGAMVASVCFVLGIFWLGWTGNYPSVHWIVPVIGSILFGASVSLVFISFSSYLVDTYLMYSASALAANTIIRSAVAAGFPLFTDQMFNNLGVNWASTIFGCIGILLMPSPFFFYKYGARIRQKSKFAPCIDLKIAKLIAAENNEKNTEGEDIV